MLRLSCRAVAIGVAVGLMLPGCSRDQTGTLEEASEPVQTASEPSVDSSPLAAGESAELAEDVGSRPVRLAPAIRSIVRGRTEPGSVALFDGQSLFGWEPADAADESSAAWEVEGGLRGTVADGGAPQTLRTFVPWQDGELRFDARSDPKTDAAVLLRMPGPNVDRLDRPYRIELNSLADPGKLSIGGFRVTPENADAEGWVTVTATLARGKINASGGNTSSSFDARRGLPAAGPIGIVVEAGSVTLRNLYFTPKVESAMSDDLADWRVVNQQMKDGSLAEVSFEAVGGGVRGTGGPGFLESVATYDDFVAQFEFTTNALDVNAGLFYRTIAGTPDAPSNGYEVQIHNGYDGPDRIPVNGGSGGIFRRQDARVVVSADTRPSVMTVNAFGDRVMTWVDGYPVVAWQDTRDDDPNPRRGRRLEAGHLSFQSHDPGSDVTIRNVRVSPLGK